MKSSIKFLLLLAAFAGFSVAAQAQTSTKTATPISGVRLSIGVESGIPTGNFSDTHNWNLGGSIQADIPVAKPLFVTINTGYNNFFGKSIAGFNTNYPDLNIIPAKAGLKFFPVSNLYIQGEAGANFLLNKAANGADKTAAFVYAPQIGFQFPVGGKSFIDAGVRYEATSSYVDGGSSKINYFGIRVAYGFGTR